MTPLVPVPAPVVSPTLVPPSPLPCRLTLSPSTATVRLVLGDVLPGEQTKLKGKALQLFLKWFLKGLRTLGLAQRVGLYKRPSNLTTHYRNCGRPAIVWEIPAAITIGFVPLPPRSADGNPDAEDPCLRPALNLPTRKGGK